MRCPTGFALLMKKFLSTASLILPWLNGNQKNFNNNHFPEQTTNRVQAGKKENASERKQGKKRAQAGKK